MLKYKILMKLFVLNCVFMCCIYGHTILKYKNMATIGRRNM